MSPFETHEVRGVVFQAACDMCGHPDATWRQKYAPEGVQPSHFDISCPICDPITAAARMPRAGQSPRKVLDYLTEVAA